METYKSVLPAFAFFLSFLIYLPIDAQEFPNPFLNNKNTFNQQEILILFNESGSNTITQQVFGYDWIEHNSDSNNDLIIPFTEKANLENINLGEGQYLSVVSGRFNDDRSDDMVYIIERDNEISVGIHTMYTEFLEADSSYLYQLDEPETYISIPIGTFTGAPRSAVGDFDGDGTDEIAIAWREASGDLVKIQVLDADNGEVLIKRAYAEDQTSLRINGYNAFDLGSGDLNGDGADEILLTGLEESSTGNADFQVFVQVYEVNTNGSAEITPRARLVIDDSHLKDYNSNENMLGYAQTAVTGFRTQTETEEDQPDDIFACFAFVYYGDPIFQYDNSFQFLIRANEDLSILNILDIIAGFASSAEFREEFPLETKVGDLNGDLTEDVVLMTSFGKIYTGENNKLVYKGNSGGVVLDENHSGVTESIDRFELGDVDKDGRDEIISFSKGIGDNNENNFFISVSGVLEDFSTDTLTGGGYTFTDLSGSNTRSYAIAAGNLDGNDLHFGEPKVLSCDYLQPMFIIGAIPSHFDVLNDTPYDINNCYPVQDCQLEVKITNKNTGSTTVQAQVTSDWAVSSTADVSAEAFSMGMGTTIEAKYGVKFDKINTETSTRSLTISITASSDDMIQYLKIPVTLYQYPVLDAALDTTCYVLAAFPDDNFTPQTIVANGKSVFNYTPDYEVGNIMSYPTFQNGYEGTPDLPKTSGNWIILDAGNVPSYSMSPSGGINYTINSTTDIDWTETSEAYAAINTGISPLGFGIGLPENEDGTEYLEAEGLPGDYPPNAIEMNFLQMYSNTISTETEFSITPTNIIGAPNEFNYLVSPKIYWNYDGSGVVRFEVDIDPREGSGSFWATAAYNELPDPALNLPYRYDLVHSPGLSNTENLDRTKSVWFSTNLPQPDDTVSMFIRIFNYSFVSTVNPVQFEVYHGDPESGGKAIADINGNTLFETVGALGERGRSITEIRFIATADLVTDDFAKIYVVLDPNNLTDEIHESNNKGWALFGYACNQPGNLLNTTVLQDKIIVPQYLTIYPNPADGHMIIVSELQVKQGTSPVVTIHSVTGEQVAQFIITSDRAGQIIWNTSTVPAGFYIVTLSDKQGILESKKVVVM
jgi:hypothetical protein